ncbi:hypothetical protein GAP32_485 [Cronobacter phage vB_CsaM_GAP32]|uniref:Uncharacterized protein n=1 Tax=Cronobacter phage vB_CsaM_GAP32 TaxID=1141136 RepID=K4F7A3_9CAUD|nr:hypothetical protein GAP32_485 [Cronobacter phage vB_CsaM_GAP32]AFC21943.1 hypothetical protein GAP32_485 [Cronobacter phage vB_CsaM_GAP32]
MFDVDDWIILVNESAFVEMHNQNGDIARRIRNKKLRIVESTSDGSVRKLVDKNGDYYEVGLYARELSRCFEKTDHPDSTPKFGAFKIIITYVENGETIEEEGVTNIHITDSTVEYKYNRKKLGFLKYSGEVKLEIADLKQITISTPQNERVYHIQNGVIVREHIMYDEERKFTNFKIG